MASLTSFIWSLLRRIFSSNNGASTSSSAPTTRRIGGLLTTGVPYNPEIGIRLLASVATFASSYLRVANKDVHTGIHGTMAETNELCCDDGACGSVYCCGTLEATMYHVNKLCRLFSHRLDGTSVFMYS